MSDNRTNEPTEAQVEAALAAHAAHKGAWVDEFKEMVCPECGWCYMTEHERKPDNKPSNKVVYARVDAHRMRAALVAAQVAATEARVERWMQLFDASSWMVSTVCNPARFAMSTCLRV